MILPIILLILITFIQTSVLAIDLVLLFLIVRSFSVESKSNYLLAFFFGLLVSLLNAEILGIMSIFYLLIVKIVHIIKSMTFAQNWVTIFPLTAVILIVSFFVKSLVLKTGQDFNLVILQLLLVLPIYIIVAFWEERFLGKTDLRLKLRNR
jgi:cell shape-determining protein MreD